MKRPLDELYIAINTDLVPHDLANIVFDEVLDGWFRCCCVASGQGEFLAGDLADDTKLDGRGRLLIPGEVPADGATLLESSLEDTAAREAVLDRLDLHTPDDAETLQISCIGSVPSRFRTLVDQQHLPRLAPSFEFKPGRSVFEMTCFDPTWVDDDVHELADRLASLCDQLGDRCVTRVEFECDGRFLANEEDWRLHFAALPLARRDMP